jgi:hypothetical protein
VLEEAGLDRYVDPRVLQREIADAHDLTQEDLDREARAFMKGQNGSPAKSPYYDHLGGYSAQEMRDYNQYSNQDDLLTRPKRGTYGRDYSADTDDELIYVTTL